VSIGSTFDCHWISSTGRDEKWSCLCLLFFEIYKRGHLHARSVTLSVHVALYGPQSIFPYYSPTTLCSPQGDILSSSGFDPWEPSPVPQTNLITSWAALWVWPLGTVTSTPDQPDYILSSSVCLNPGNRHQYPRPIWLHTEPLCGFDPWEPSPVPQTNLITYCAALCVLTLGTFTSTPDQPDYNHMLNTLYSINIRALEVKMSSSLNCSYIHGNEQFNIYSGSFSEHFLSKRFIQIVQRRHILIKYHI